MKILFSSDLHGMDIAFERFSALLKMGRYDAGVLGGDLLDEWLPDSTVEHLLGIGPDELLDELPGEMEDPVEAYHHSAPMERNREALAVRMRGLQAVLDDARVPILLVLGNHDHIPWPDTEFITDIHMKRVELSGRAFVGYRWTAMERSDSEFASDAEELGRLVDRTSILVSHSPPYGILDGLRFRGNHFGLKALRNLRPRPHLHLFGHVHHLAGHRGRRINGAWPRIRTFFEIDVGRRHVCTVV